MHIHTTAAAAPISAIPTTKDEQGLNLYCVLGSLNQPIPSSVLRAGVHGHFLLLKITDVFTAHRC